MQSDHYLLHFRTIFECLRGSKKRPKSDGFSLRSSPVFAQETKETTQNSPCESLGAPCAPQKSPWGAHGPQTAAFGVTQGPPLVVFGAPPEPICPILKVRGTQKIGESSVHVLCCCSYDSGRRVHSRTENDRKKWREFRPCTLLLFLQIWPQSTQQD